MKRFAPALLALSFSLAASPAAAQDLRARVVDLFRFGNCGEPLCLPVSAAEHGRHFVPALAQGRNDLLGFLNNAIGVSVASIPISATTSGATFVFEEGRPVKTSISAGPLFAERAETLGRRRLLVGANVNSLRFRSLRGVPTDRLVFNFTHQDVSGGQGLGFPDYTNDLIQVTTDLGLSMFVTTTFATFGLTDRIDVGVAVPFVRSSIEGTSAAQLFAFGPASPHLFEGGGGTRTPVAAAAASGSAFGVGDVALRAKVHLGGQRGLRYAFLGDARLPTGDTLNFSGAGGLSVRGVGIVSARYGDFSPHLNAGYVYRGATVQTDGLLATVGFDQLVAPWATVALDLISEWQVGESSLTLPGPVQYLRPYARTVDPTLIPDRRDDRIDASFGVKLTTAGGFTTLLNALVPVNRGGLRPDVVWTVGGEFAF